MKLVVRLRANRGILIVKAWVIYKLKGNKTITSFDK